MNQVPEFSKQAPEYARFRPRYPDEVFSYLAGLAPGHTLAWDCGCGNGQASTGLAPYFAGVIATDLSAGQIANAIANPKVSYRVAPAEQSGLETGSVDLITVAQAMHWFDLDGFYAEARRVLRPGGVLAAWCYKLPIIKPAVDHLVNWAFDDLFGPYWAPGAQWVSENYRTIPFPFPPPAAVAKQPPPAYFDSIMSLEDIVGYVASWSSRQKYIAAHGVDPLPDLRARIAAAWGDPNERRPGRWPLHFKIGERRDA